MRLPATLCLLLAISPPISTSAESTLALVWHVETAAGEVRDSRDAELPINPASVVKLATALRALELLGPDHRYETRFGARGRFDREAGVLHGDLVVAGGGDPDFHVENAFLVARSLNDKGLRTVRGRLLLDDRFWIGWEGGSERKQTGEPRTRMMATRLRDAFDPDRWTTPTIRLIEAFRERAEISSEAPAVVFESQAPGAEAPGAVQELVLHRSNPLRQILKRFNSYSNNDIERLGDAVGRPAELAADLRSRWRTSVERTRLETLSGLGTNRMTASQVVRLLRELEATCRNLDLRLQDLLPAIGCDPGTLEHFPRLAGIAVGSLVAKTGTLARTDGGVAVLAGVAHTNQGDRFFCIAATNAGRKLAEARAQQQQWVLDLFQANGGAAAHPCGSPVVHSDHDVRLAAIAAPG